MKFRKLRTYRAYAAVYDDFKGDRSATIDLIAGLIDTHRPGAKTVLDLACGTGSITQGLADRFTIVGLDNSAEMLRIAKPKLPMTRFVQADMVDFELAEKFDVVYCLHNSVNHVSGLDRWEQLFATVADHLVGGGLFIFDFNPVAKLNQMANDGPGITAVGADYVVTDVLNGGATGEYVWAMKILRKQGERYVLYDEPVPVYSYPEYKVERALARRFTIAEQFVPENPAINDEVDRLYYVCIKK